MKLDSLIREFNRLPSVQIRYMVESDLPALEWGGEFKHFRKMYAEAFQRYLRGLSLLWVAELDGKVIGQVFVQLNCDRPELANGRDRAYLYSFRVQGGYRSRGIGTRMMQVVEEDLRDRGFRYVTLNVARDNTRAQDLYIRRGYKVIAPEPGEWSYQDDRGDWQHVKEPAWRMEKQIS